jgi:phosphorylated adapter RNA export protein
VRRISHFTNISISEIADQIADQLGETEVPVCKKSQIVEACGVEQTQAWLDETLAIEAGGGMMVSTGERRRTPGGVFFYVVKGRLSKELRRQLFPYPPKKKSPQKPATQELPVEEAITERFLKP